MKTRTTRGGATYYLECIDCGKEKATKSQQQGKRCKSCSKTKTVDGKRQCRKCEQWLDATPSNFYYHSKSKGILKRLCKPCDNKRKTEWNQANPEKKRLHGINTWKKNYHRWKQNPVWRLKRIVSSAVANAMAGRGYSKDNSSWKALPYTPQQLKEHLERQFADWMTWENYGSRWDIDHIYPQSLLPYDSLDHPNFIRCWSLDNLQPLDKIANIKKSNRILRERK